MRNFVLIFWFILIIDNFVGAKVFLKSEHAKIRTSLPKNIKYFETSTLFTVADFIPYGRRKRSPNSSIHILFVAYKREFDLEVEPVDEYHSKAFLSEPIRINLISQNKHRTIRQTPEGMITGRLMDNSANSSVFGFFVNGSLDVVVHSGLEHFYIKPMKQYIEATNERIVIFRESDFSYEKELSNSKPLISNCGVKDSNFTRTTDITGKAVRKEKRKANQSRHFKLCELHVVADHKFFNIIGKNSVEATVNEIYQYVAVANDIFYGTDFNMVDIVGLQLKEITVLETSDRDGFNRKYFSDAEQLLDNFEKQSRHGFHFETKNNAEFCLVVLLTVRILNGSIIGLAYQGSTIQKSWGICGKTHNSLLVTTSIEGHLLSPYYIALALAHEFGHSFGSVHDMPGIFPEYNCTPGGNQGNYLMFALILTPGFRPNNKLFSKCSRYFINPLLDKSCLKTVPLSVCGNGVVEEDEECDCGKPESCHETDPCCSLPTSDTPCRFDRKNGKFCTPRYSPCCEKICKLTPKYANKVCRERTECSEPVSCDGTSGVCPSPKIFSNTLCMNNTRTCTNGSCIQSVCSLTGPNMVECQCKDNNNLCRVCCKNKFHDNSKCKVINHTALPIKNLERLYKLPATGCNQEQGYCAANHECLEYMDNPFLEQSLDSSATFFKNVWYHLLLISSIVGFLLLSLTHYKKQKRIPPYLYLQGIGEGKYELHSLEYLLNKLEKKHSNTLQLIDEDHKIGFKSMLRLLWLFPLTKKGLLKVACARFTYEKEVVEFLIENGEPLNEFKTMVKTKNVRSSIIQEEDIEQDLVINAETRPRGGSNQGSTSV